MRRTATLQPHTNRVGSPPVSTGQEVDGDSDLEAQSAPCCCIRRGVFRPFSSMRSGGNIDDSQRNVNDTTGDQPIQAGQRPTQAEAPIRAYFLTIAETSLA